MRDDEKPASKLKDPDKLQRFIEWFRLVNDAEAKQRKLEEEDLEFQVPENQWDPRAKVDRKGRPMLSISLLQQPLQLVLNQAAKAHLGIQLHPVSEDADTDLAEVKQGLCERIQRDGKADVARLWAFDRAIRCGRGWYRIVADYDEDSDNPTDQEIRYKRLLHQDMVYPDPAAQEPDYSDARFIIVAGYVPMDSFREEYPKAEYAQTSDFKSPTHCPPEWVNVRGEFCDPLVAEIFYKVQVPEDPRGCKEVWRAVVTGREILEDGPFMPGPDKRARKYIPLVPVIGRELQTVKGERMWEGMVRPAKDAQRFYNFAASSMVERMAMEPKAPFVLYDETIEGYEPEWEEANTSNRPFLRTKMITHDGKPLPLPQRAQIDMSGTSLAIMGAQQGREMVQVATAVFDPSLGELPKSRESQSGRAIMALQQQADAGTSHYLDNFKLISLPLEARIIMDMLPVVYDRPGRVTQILTGEDEPKSVMLGRPFVYGDGGRPMPAKRGQQGAKIYDLSKGRYSVVASVGKSPQTRLQQGQEFLTAVIQAVPEITPFIGDLIFKFRDEPGAKEISERLRRHLMATNPAILGEKDSGEDAKAKAMALEQQMGMMQQQLQQAMQYIQTEQAKHEAQVRIAEMKEQAALAKAEMDNHYKLKIAEIQAAQKGTDTVVDSRDKALDRNLELTIHREEMAHEVAMAAGGAQTVKSVREGGQENEQASENETGGMMSRESEDSTESGHEQAME